MTQIGISSRGNKESQAYDQLLNLISCQGMKVKTITRYHSTTLHPKWESPMTLSVGKTQPPGNLHMAGLDWCNHLGKQLASSCQAEFLNTWSPSNCALKSIPKKKLSLHPRETLTQGYPVICPPQIVSFKITWKNTGKCPQIGKIDK